MPTPGFSEIVAIEDFEKGLTMSGIEASALPSGEHPVADFVRDGFDRLGRVLFPPSRSEGEIPDVFGTPTD